MYRRLLGYVLSWSALLLTTCAKADDSGIGPSSHSGDLCDQICTKAVSVGCKPCSDVALSYCEDRLTRACSQQETAWMNCVIDNPQVTCSTEGAIVGCDTESAAIDTCLAEKKDTCKTAK